MLRQFLAQYRRRLVPTDLRRSISASPPLDPDATATIPVRHTLYLNSIFPVILGKLDLRRLLIGVSKQETLERVTETLKSVPEVNVEAITPRERDGGVIVTLSAPAGRAGEAVEQQVRSKLEDAHTFSYWTSLFSTRGHQEPAYLVRGTPWVEDMDRYSNNTLRVEFEGGDLSQETLFQHFRPYGKIQDISVQPPSSKDLPRFATIKYDSLRSGTTAKHCLHGALLDGTVVHILYAERVSAHHIREFASSHPRIMLPLLVALVGGISLTVFDPVREEFIRNKIYGGPASWGLVQWLKEETIGRLGLSSWSDPAHADTGIERDRAVAKNLIVNWLRDAPDTFIVLNGAKGSGKETLLKEALNDRQNVLILDVDKINKAGEPKVVGELASAVGYFPRFVIFDSLNGLIDLASLGLIGQKAGFTSDTTSQLKHILDVTTSALTTVAKSARAQSKRLSELETARRETAEERAAFTEKVNKAGIRDGRIDAVAGTGLMSELGGGIEHTHYVNIIGPHSWAKVRDWTRAEETGRPAPGLADGLPIVVLKDYGLRASSEAKQELLTEVLAEWAASLIEQSIAHVIITSDATTGFKALAKAMPQKTFNTISLNDADPESSFTFVAARVGMLGTLEQSESEVKAHIAKLGGRRTDLELLITKLKARQATGDVPQLPAADLVRDSVGEIIERAAGEVRKNYFTQEGRVPAWIIAKGLAESETGEIKYADVLFNSFKGDESILRGLEQADMINIHHHSGRPSLIRPARPVYLSVFKLLASDPIFSSSLSYELNEQQIKKVEEDVHKATAELGELSILGNTLAGRIGSGVPPEIGQRVEVLLGRLHTAEAKLEVLERDKVTLAKVFKTEV